MEKSSGEGGLAIISGGSSGIGLACAVRLADSGHRVAILSRNPAGLAEARSVIERACPAARVEGRIVDIADAAACSGVVGTLIEDYGAPEWVIASAGLARPGLFLEQPVEDHDLQIRVNYMGTVHLVHAAAPGMAKAGRGRIVLVSSGASFFGIYGYSAYAPSKFAVRGLGEVLRLELEGHGVSVTVACPPDTDTPQLAEEEKTKPAITRRITAGGGRWTADMVAEAILAGAERGRFIVAPGASNAALSVFHSFAGPALRHWQRRLIRAATDVEGRGTGR